MNKILKDLGASEDLLLDATTPLKVTQVRNGVDVEVTKINANTIPVQGKFGELGFVSIQNIVDNAQNTAVSAQNTAVSAQNTADNAQNTADNAQNTADNAQNTVDNAQNTADNAQNTADNALTTINTQIIETVTYNNHSFSLGEIVAYSDIGQWVPAHTIFTGNFGVIIQIIDTNTVIIAKKGSYIPNIFKDTTNTLYPANTKVYVGSNGLIGVKSLGVNLSSEVDRDNIEVGIVGTTHTLLTFRRELINTAYVDSFNRSNVHLNPVTSIGTFKSGLFFMRLEYSESVLGNITTKPISCLCYVNEFYETTTSIFVQPSGTTSWNDKRRIDINCKIELIGEEIGMGLITNFAIDTSIVGATLSLKQIINYRGL